MTISIDFKNRTIKNSKGEDFEYTESNVEKVMLQIDNFIFLLDDFTWNVDLDFVMGKVRTRRNEALAKTDKFFLSDTSSLLVTAEKTILKGERQKLRDLTEGITTIEQAIKSLKNVGALSCAIERKYP